MIIGPDPIIRTLDGFGIKLPLSNYRFFRRREQEQRPR
jgi:hypothetical protein